jgi:hypothetical protein
VTEIVTVTPPAQTVNIPVSSLSAAQSLPLSASLGSAASPVVNPSVRPSVIAPSIPGVTISPAASPSAAQLTGSQGHSRDADTDADGVTTSGNGIPNMTAAAAAGATEVTRVAYLGQKKPFIPGVIVVGKMN